MPGVHRNDDSRYCGAGTIVVGQDKVYCNGKLAAVVGDPNSHGSGNLVAAYGAQNVYVNGKLLMVAPGDTAVADDLGHMPGEDDPSGHSPNVFCYG